jgi:hypothetical protein
MAKAKKTRKEYHDNSEVGQVVTTPTGDEVVILKKTDDGQCYVVNVHAYNPRFLKDADGDACAGDEEVEVPDAAPAPKGEVQTSA